jgi:hypothetical protein
MNNNQRVVVGYDILFPYNEVPNCLNPKFLEFAYHTDYTFDTSEHFFRNKIKGEWSVFNARFNVQLNDEKGFPGYFGIETRSVHAIIRERERGNCYDWYYLIEPYGDIANFLGLDKQVNNIPFSKFIPSKTLEEIRNWGGYLVINYVIDGNISKYQLIKLYKCLRDLNIPPNKIIICHNDFHLEQMMKPIFGNFMPKLIHFCWSLNSKAEEYFKKKQQDDYSFWLDDTKKAEYSFSNDDDVENYNNKKHKFLNFNRRIRTHRAEILYFLWKNDIIQNNLVSYDYKLLTENSLDELKRKLNEQEFNNFENFLKETSPNTIDYTDLENVWGYGFENKDVYMKSLISIVSETLFYEESGYLSEKIWKPIVHGHPFILAGPHNSLKFLKNMGFQTFHPIINESYDSEKNPNIRLSMIFDEIKRLNSYTVEELSEIVKQLLPRLKHNKKLMYDIGSKKISLDYNHFLALTSKEHSVNNQKLKTSIL